LRTGCTTVSRLARKAQRPPIDGAYTITPEGIANNTITRNPDARVFISSFEEWLKAGYYKGGGTDAGYWQFPYQSDEQTVPGRPPGEPNTANISGVFLGTIEVGAFTASVGPYGTFDQGGNVWEWSETIIDSPVTFDPILRGLHGGGWAGEQREVLSVGALIHGSPERNNGVRGIRIASIPEPATVMPSMLALLWLVGVVRRRAQ